MVVFRTNESVLYLTKVGLGRVIGIFEKSTDEFTEAREKYEKSTGKFTEARIKFGNSTKKFTKNTDKFEKSTGK